ncbi:unnamed protein product, partial [marine sediment metagenome]
TIGSADQADTARLSQNTAEHTSDPKRWWFIV